MYAAIADLVTVLEKLLAGDIRTAATIRPYVTTRVYKYSYESLVCLQYVKDPWIGRCIYLTLPIRVLYVCLLYTYVHHYNK